MLLENEVDRLSKVLPEVLNNKGYFSMHKRDYDIPAFLNSGIHSDLVVFSYCSKLDPQRFVSYTIWPSLHRAELSITATVFIQGRPDCGS